MTDNEITYDSSDNSNGIVPTSQGWHKWKSEDSTFVVQFTISSPGFNCVVAYHIYADFTV
jgi:hypothetical protein